MLRLRWPPRALALGAAGSAMIGPYLIHFAFGADVEAEYISGVHGRYWLPALPALLIPLAATRLARAQALVPRIALGSALFSITLTCWTLLHRYYLP